MSFLEPTLTHLGWVRRVRHSDFNFRSLGGPSLLSPAQAMHWVGLDHHKEADRAIWTYLCSGRVLLEGIAPDGPRDLIHYECRGPHALDARGAIAELPRKTGVAPPSGVTWGYEPTSVAQLLRTAEVGVIGGANLADSFGVTIWMVGTSVVRTIDHTAIEPEARRTNSRIPPKVMELAAEQRAVEEIRAFAEVVEYEPEDVLVQLYGVNALALKRKLQAMSSEQMRELIADHAANLLRDRPDELGLTPEQVRAGKRIRADSTAYVFYPAGQVELDYDAATAKPGTKTNSRDGRLREIVEAYAALRETGYVEELAPAYPLGDGVSLSPLIEAPSEVPRAFKPKATPAPMPVEGLKPPFAIIETPGPEENVIFVNLRDHILCAHHFPQYEQRHAKATRGLVKTCAAEGCGKTFRAETGWVKRCPDCRIGKDPEAKRANDRKRKQRQRERKRGESGLSQ